MMFSSRRYLRQGSMLRVDRDPTVSIPIEDIEAGIRNAEVCLAEITTDNPNVWFELGFAIPSQRDVVLICSSERESRFPFDIQHRSIIRYNTESSSDFEALKDRITERLRAILSKEGASFRQPSCLPSRRLRAWHSMKWLHWSQ